MKHEMPSEESGRTPVKLLFAAVGLILSTTNLKAQGQLASGFEGWCAATTYAYEGDGHLNENTPAAFGVKVTTQGFNFSTEEEGDSCIFSNPTPVRDFEAILFDANCSSPHASAMGQDYLMPLRAMLQTATDESNDTTRAFLIMPNNVIVPNVVEELRPCLTFRNSEMHFKLGYEAGFYQPNVRSEAAKYIADLIYSGVAGSDGISPSEIIGLEPNAGDSYLVGTTSCGMDCAYPFIFNVRNGREVKLNLNLRREFDEGGVANFAFTMAHDDGRLLVSWRSRNSECILEEILVEDSTMASKRRHITAAGNYDFLPPSPLSCPAN